MTALPAIEPKQLLAQHLAVLREYGERVLLENGSLSESEETEKACRMQEFLGIGSSFKLTSREMVVLLYGGLLASRSKGSYRCPSCRGRSGHGA